MQHEPKTESIVFLERNTFNVPFRRPNFPHEWIEYGETDGSQAVDRLRNASIAICNTARGGLVDDQALLGALKTGQLGGAGIDILRVEPPREGNPLLEVDLANLIVTPHNAWASRQAMQTLADQLVDNLEAFVRGEPRNLIT